VGGEEEEFLSFSEGGLGQGSMNGGGKVRHKVPFTKKARVPEGGGGGKKKKITPSAFGYFKYPQRKKETVKGRKWTGEEKRESLQTLEESFVHKERFHR